MKAILMSEKPERVVKILNGEMSILPRKGTRLHDAIQKLIAEQGKCEIYLYVTKDKDYVVKEIEKEHRANQKIVYELETKEEIKGVNPNRILNGKVVAKFEASAELIKYQGDLEYAYTDLLKGSCLSLAEFRNYLFVEGKGLYHTALNILPGTLKAFDKPKEISEFRQGYNYFFKNKTCSDCPRINCDSSNCLVLKPLTKAPKTFYYIEV